MTVPVSFVPWRDISSLLAPEPGRRHALPGFDDHYIDIVDYIVRCTHQIWEGKNLALIRTHYSHDCVIHTLAGETMGVDAVIGGTLATLQGFPDRLLYADHVIWSCISPGTYYTSHRIVSHMTHQGENEYGPPSGRRATVRTIADCAVAANRIFEEWLVRDNWQLAADIGADPIAIAAAQARGDARNPTTRDYWSRERARTFAHPAPTHVGVRHDAACYARAVFGAWNERALGRLAEIYSPTVEWSGPAGRSLFGCGPVTGFVASLLAALPDAVVSIEHIASVPFFDLGEDVAVRWSLAGTHTGPGLHGAPTGRPVYLLAITHWRICQGRITEEYTVYDEIALLRQLLQDSS